LFPNIRLEVDSSVFSIANIASGELVMDYLVVLKIIVVVLIGVFFFNAIIGGFGLSTAIVSLIVFILLALLIFSRRQHLSGGE
jgi:hypothetical protein